MTKSPLKKTRKPYVLKMLHAGEQRIVGFYRSAEDAITEARSINKNRLRSGGPEFVDDIIIIYDQAGEPPFIAHQENGATS